MVVSKVGFFTNKSVITAIEHLRVIAPLKTTGIDVVLFSNDNDFRDDFAKECQIFVIQREFAGNFTRYQALRKYADKEGIPIVLDLDDNLLELYENHPDRENLVYAAHLLPIVQSIVEANAITVSTPELMEAIKKYNPNIYLLPNYLDDKVWSLKEPRVSKISTVEVLFMGSATHIIDIKQIVPALEEVADKYPEAHFLFVGVDAPDKLVSRHRAKSIPSKTYEYVEFVKQINQIDADIAIAPLQTNEFNACKSPLKFFEYTAMGLPGVYSDIGSYSRVITNKITGLLSSMEKSDWVEKIGYLISNQDERLRISKAAQESVQKHYLLSQNAELWRDTYEDILKKPRVFSKNLQISSNQLANINLQLSSLIDRNNKQVQFLGREIEQYKAQEEKYEGDIMQMKKEVERLFKEKNTLDQEIEQYKAREEKYEGEVTVYKNQLLQLNEELRAIYDSRSWKITKIFRSSSQKNFVTKVMPSRSVENDEVALIRNSELFDRDWYVKRYPDVKNCRMEPAKHYCFYGGFEGRDPSTKFCSSFYLEAYPDVKDAAINPLVHYLLYGKIEGRLILPDSNQINPYFNLEQFREAKGTQGHFTQKAVQILRDEGLGSLINKTRKKIVQSREFENAINEADSEKEIEISVIIPAYNAVAYTKECIDKVYTTGSDHTFEVIVVDNASADETQAEMEKESLKRTDFSYYRMKENLGFAGGVNFGIQKAKGQYVVILNNDTLPTAGWLDDMVVAFETNPTLGIVSPVTNYVGEGPQLEISAKDIKPEDIDTYALGLKGRDVCYEPGRLVFFCVMIRRSVFEQNGLLDENYIKGNFEDDDYCLRAILSGYKLGIAKSAFVFHHGSITFKENKIVHSDHMELNRERFFLKTGRLARSLRVPCEKTQNPQINVIVRTLNRKHLLKNALTSLANQNFRDFKVVLVNDGGESVQDLVDIYSRHFPITYVNHENSKGRTPALNAGVFNSNTKWVAFLDDDDIVYPWHLATLYNHAQFTKNGMMFYSDYNRTLFQTNSSLSPVLLRGIEPWQYDKDQLWVSNRIPMHSWLIARECFEKVGFFDENQAMLEDFEFLVRLSKEYNFYHVNRVTCEYRYYLDGMNSMINQRGKTLEALKYIYAKHEAYNQNIENNRSFELEALKVQTEKIELLREKMNDNPENNSKLTRQMTKLMLGF